MLSNMIIIKLLEFIKNYLNFKPSKCLSCILTEKSAPSIPTDPCLIHAPLVIIIVGLPFRGKSMAAHKLARHLNWKGDNAKVFQVECDSTPDTISDVQAWFEKGNDVAIIDGMHLSIESRQTLISFCAGNSFNHLVIEFSCEEKEVEGNIRETGEFFKKYENHPSWTNDSWEKIRKYASTFEPCETNREGPLITVQNSENPALHSVTAYGVLGPLQTSVVGILSSPVVKNQVYYFSRHGESEYNILGRIGGDAELSPRGMRYAKRLTEYFTSSNNVKSAPSMVWTSELRRTIQTAENVTGIHASVKDLNEIDAGICEGLTYEEIQEKYPHEFAWRDQDKLKYRYPHGESYLDLLQRVDNVIQALLTQQRVLVVSHQAVLRCVVAYFTGTNLQKIPYINVPLHTIIVAKSHGYSFTIEKVPLSVECVDTYRVKPKNCSADRNDSDALNTVPAHFDSLI